VFYICQFFRGRCYTFLYPLGQLLEHFVPFCSVLVCIIIYTLIRTVFNEGINDDNDVCMYVLNAIAKLY